MRSRVRQKKTIHSVLMSNIRGDNAHGKSQSEENGNCVRGTTVVQDGGMTAGWYNHPGGFHAFKMFH